MITCPNINLESWKSLNNLIPDISYHVWNKLEGNISNDGKSINDIDRFNQLLEDNNNDYKQTYLQFLGVEDTKIDYQFKSVNTIIKNINKIENWSKQIKDINQLLDKIQKDLGIPKEQIELIKQSEGNSINEKLLDFTSKYSYTTQVKTSTEVEGPHFGGEWAIKDNWIIKKSLGSYEVWVKDEDGEHFKYSAKSEEHARQLINDVTDSHVKNTQIYSNLTVPGGTNYTENEISTPLITPSIKGHAQFSTDQGIGWFRSDDKEQGEIEKIRNVYLKDIKIEISDFKNTSLTDYEHFTADVTVYHKNEKIPFTRFIIQKTPNSDIVSIQDIHKPKDVGKGVGSAAYIILAQELEKQNLRLFSSASLNEGSKAMWEDLYNNGYAAKTATRYVVLTNTTKEQFTGLYKDINNSKNIDNSKTRRILEIQSDLFQKGRDNDNLISKRNVPYPEDIDEIVNNYVDGQPITDEERDLVINYLQTEDVSTKKLKENQFLQLLNKDNNWVTFFIKSIIQDSAKKGYEKVLFPKGETAAKVEGHNTLANEINRINKSIEDLNNIKNGNLFKDITEIHLNKEQTDEYGFFNFEYVRLQNTKDRPGDHIEILGENYTGYYIFGYNTRANHDIKVLKITNSQARKLFDESSYEFDKLPMNVRQILLTNNISYLSELDVDKAIKKLEDKRQELKSQGIEKLKPIEAFYEIKVQNILKKIDPNIKTTTDEYNNQWLEYELTDKDLNNIEFQKKDGTSYKFDKKLNEQIKTILQKLYPDINLKYTNNLEGIRGQYQAGQILINSLLENTDTLPHEYAHHYIKMFIKSDIVRQGINLFGSEEKLVQSIGEQSIRALKWYNRFYDWLKGLFSSKQSILNELTNNFLERNELLNKSIISTEKMYQKITKDEIIGNINLDKELLEEDKTVIEDISQLDNMMTLKHKAIQALESKLELQIQRKQVSSDEKEAREGFIEKLSNLEAEEAMILFTIQAAKDTNRIYKDWTKIKEELNKIKDGTSDKSKEEVLTPGRLYYWKDYLSAYDSIEEFQATLMDDDRLDKINVEITKGKKVKLSSILSDTIEKKNDIRKLYDKLGLDLTAKDLEPYYNRIYRDFELQMSKKYKTLTTKEKESISEADYIRSQKYYEDVNLKQQTRLLIRKELLKANKDINIASRYAGIVLDSSDPIIAAMSKRMILAEIETNSKKLKFRDEIVPLMEELYKFYKGKKTMKEIYDFMLEKDDKGNYTGHIISKFTSDFWDNYEIKRQQLKSDNKLDAKQRRKQLREWRRMYTSFHQKEFNIDKWKYIDSLKEKGLLNEQEYTDLEYNDQSYDPLTSYELYDSNVISKEVADLIGTWVSDNLWNYIDPDKENRQWTELKRILKNPNDPRSKFYNFIKEKEDEANSYLSSNMKLNHGKLPAITKKGKERFEEGESPLQLAKETLKRWFDVLSDDTERGNEPVIDEQGNLRYFVPMYFTGELKKYQVFDRNKLLKEFSKKSEAENYVLKVNPKYEIKTRRALEDQSYDLSTMYFRFYSSAVDYNSKNSILPEMEMARYFVNNREVTRTDPQGNPIKKLFRVTKKEDTESKPGKGGRLAEQLNDWFEMVFYGVKENKEGSFKIFGMNIDVAKMFNSISRYTSLNILALNFRAGIANTVLGEALQASEAFAKQHMSSKSYTKANIFYTHHLPGIIGDIGRTKKESIINLLYESFNIPTDPIDTNLRDNTRLKKLASFSSLYFFMHAGDDYMQTRMFLGMLTEKKAYDKDGKLLESMLDMYYKKSFYVFNGLKYEKRKFGKVFKYFKDNIEIKEFEYTKNLSKSSVKVLNELSINLEVDLEKSNWTKLDQDNFASKVKGVISGVHGEYSDLGRIAIQRSSIGRMALMFRKFIVPGVTKRYKKNTYIERVGDYTEGYYRTTGRFITNLAKELKTYQFTVFGEEWNKLSDMEKSNILRTTSEIGFLITAYVLANAFIKLGEDDDKWVYDFAAYQMLRFKTELWFYINPYEAQKILRSPAASMSVLENTFKLFHQIFQPTERYERGIWDGHLKLEKIMWDFVPVARSFYQTKDIKSQINFVR